MRTLLERTFRPFFLLTGAGTALAGAYALAPEWALTKLGRLSYLEEYTILVQHWGIMVGLMGVFMMGAALVPAWRFPILTYSAVEKAYMVSLVLAHLDQGYSRGFWIAAIMDATVVLYTVLYFVFCGFGSSPRGTSRSR